MPDEESRAAAWRDQQVRRAQFIRDTEKRLRGSQSASKALITRWAAVINRTQEDTR